MALTSYYPEMGAAEPPDTQIQASLSHYGRHWFLKTPLELKGRGVEFTGKNGGTNVPHKADWNTYKVTDRAFRIICEKYAVSSVSLL